MTDQPKPCRSTQHCAVHGFCHRCTPSLDDATAHLVEAIDAAGIEYPTSSRVYAQLAATVRDAARTPARQTTGQDNTACSLPGFAGCECNHLTGCEHPAPAGAKPDPAVVEQFIQHMATQPDPTTADDPIPLRWGLGDVMHGDDDSVIVCLSGPNREPYALHLEPEQRDALRDDLTAPDAGPDDTDLPARLRATLTERFTELGNPFSEMRIQFKGPDGWPASKPVGPDAVAEVLRELLTAPAVGQPAEAHDTEMRVRWSVKSSYPNGGTFSLPAIDDRTGAEKYLTAARESSPEASHRLVRETTTWTVEDER
ncbi:hypothetical protein [Streptomyces sp. NPDC056049]|uniref:hypothetical protein n=1 Tax=Streptomyces sp. NPDC056049 TaxID=3345693 RepID=UPI0035DDFB18